MPVVEAHERRPPANEATRKASSSSFRLARSASVRLRTTSGMLGSVLAFLGFSSSADAESDEASAASFNPGAKPLRNSSRGAGFRSPIGQYYHLLSMSTDYMFDNIQTMIIYSTNPRQCIQTNHFDNRQWNIQDLAQAPSVLCFQNLHGRVLVCCHMRLRCKLPGFQAMASSSHLHLLFRSWLARSICMPALQSYMHLQDCAHQHHHTQTCHLARPQIPT